MAAEVPWQSAYGTVQRMARLHLEANVLIEAPLSTAQLVEALYPEREALGVAGQHARRRIFKALQALSTRGLAGYCHRGEPKTNKMKQTVRPWLWHPVGTSMMAVHKIGDEIEHAGCRWRCVAVL